MSDDFWAEESISAQRAKFGGETREEVEDRLIGCSNSIFGGILEGGVADLWKAVKNDIPALNYLAEVYAERTGAQIRTVQGDGIYPVRCVAKSVLLSSKRLPVEVHERFERRKYHEQLKARQVDFRVESDILVLEDY